MAGRIAMHCDSQLSSPSPPLVATPPSYNSLQRHRRAEQSNQDSYVVAQGRYE